MARFDMNASVSSARAMVILSSCLVLGTLIGLLPHNSTGQNLRKVQQQQNPTAGDSGALRSKLPDASLFSRPVLPSKAGDRALGEGNNFVWDGDYAFGAVQEQGLALDVDIVFPDFSFSFAFEGSFSYDYYF